MSATHLANTTLIVGLGKTGLSVAHYLHSQSIDFMVVDSRVSPPGKEALLASYPQCKTDFGAFNAALFASVKQLVVSPGVSITATPAIVAAQKNGVEVVGDVELFARQAQAPIIAITGSNGKTTVTTLLGEMAEASGKAVKVIGNVGTPCLDVLREDTKKTDLYILELSSFQLETTQSLKAVSATVLNISEDHLDRYNGNVQTYANAKGRIFQQAEYCVVNRDDELVMALAKANEPQSLPVTSFGLNPPASKQWGIIEQSGVEYIAYGDKPLLAVSEIRLPGRHNLANTLAALALGHLAGLNVKAMLASAKTFAGVKHRTQWVAERYGVNWFNDSKGTNVGATIAAVSGLSGKTVLIVGGQGKGADFSPLSPVLKQSARAVVLIGEDAELIANKLDESTPRVYADNMDDAVLVAADLAREGDNVLLSPACASFDMFANYEERGDIFIECVRSLAHD